MQHTSGIILFVSKLLQKKELDIFAVIELIDSVLDIPDKTEAIAKTFFIKYMTKLRMDVKNMMLHYIPRRCKSQIFRGDCPSDDPEHFFREAIFVPYLDHLIVEMEDRFFDQKQKCRSLWGLISNY